MESASRDMVSFAALLYVASLMALSNRKGVPESVIDLAKEHLITANAALGAAGYPPAMASGIDEVRNGGSGDVTFSGGPGSSAVLISGQTAAQCSGMLYREPA